MRLKMCGNNLKPGVLVLAHGSRNPLWVKEIEEIAARVKADFPDLPMTTAYLELVPGQSIEEGVYTLERRGVNQILIIPLFITMGSTHLEEIRYAFGLLETSSIPTDLQPISTQAEILWCSPLEAHPLILEILEERAQVLSNCPKEEVLLLIGHGSEIPGFKEKWAELLQNLSLHLKVKLGFKGVSYATLKGKQAMPRARALARKNRLIVLPIFLSEGYFTQTVIPSQLQGINCAFNGKTYLPHPNISNWISQTIHEKLQRRPE